MITEQEDRSWDISRCTPFPPRARRLPQAKSPDPTAIAAAAVRLGCRSVAFTYNDPVIFLEYAIDTAKACQDGLYAIGNNRFEGKEKIETFYTRRRSGTIMTRRLISNLRVWGEDGPRARMVGIMILYRAEGGSAFQGARPPSMIADFEAQCVRVDGGLWRFQSHILRPFMR